MSPFVRVTCPTCDEDRSVLIQAAKILHYPDSSEWIGYRCPACQNDHKTPLPSMYAAHAREIGLPIIDLPELTTSDAPPLTEDDLIAFGRALEAAEEITV